MEAMRAYMYLRKSRADTADESIEDTLRRHEGILREFAARQGIAVVGVYKEVVSGDSLYARAQMLKLLEDVEAGEADAVLCMDIDRLGRGSMADQGLIIDTFKAAGVRIVTPRKVYDLNNELDEEYTEFETFLARRELKIIKRRLQRGIRETIQEGGYIANAPYGYVKTTVDRKPTLKINEEEAAFVRILFDMYVNKGMGCQSIADALNRMGAKPHRADAFGRTSILHILKNPVFCGCVAWNRRQQIRKGKRGNEKHITVYNDKKDWIVVEGIHEPIISRELWEKAQEILEKRYHPPYNNGTPRSPLAGIVRCRACGRTMVRMPFDSKRPNGADNLICPTRGCCAATRLDRVEAAVLETLRQKLEEYRARLAADSAEGEADYAKAADAARRELETLGRQKEKLHDLLEQGVYDAETFLARSAALKGRAEELRGTLAELEEAARRESAERLEERIGRIAAGLAAYKESGIADRNRILKSLIESAAYYKAKGWPPTRFELEIMLK